MLLSSPLYTHPSHQPYIILYNHHNLLNFYIVLYNHHNHHKLYITIIIIITLYNKHNYNATL